MSHLQHAYQAALATGVGQCKIAMPEGLRPLLKEVPDCIFIPQTPSGTISSASYDELLRLANEADGVFITEDIGRNNETLSLIERLINNTATPLTVAGEVVLSLRYEPTILTQRAETLILLRSTQLQDMLRPLDLPIALTQRLNWQTYIERLEELSASFTQSHWLIDTEQWLHAASNGRVSSTRIDRTHQPPDFLTTAGAIATVCWLQHPDKPFEAITTAAFVSSKTSNNSSQDMISEIKKLLSGYE